MVSGSTMSNSNQPNITDMENRGISNAIQHVSSVNRTLECGHTVLKGGLRGFNS